jgi:Relaxase/Mobilisation nuclease domain
VIIKGKARGNGRQLGQYLITPGENERVEVVEVRGAAAPDVPGAVLEMDAVSACARTAKPLYHATINTRANERMTAEQRMYAVDRLERELGFTGQPRVVVIHEKKDRNGDLREHCHIVWSRIDLEHQRAIRIDHNYRKHELVARELERELGFTRTQGAHIERDGQTRPGRTASQWELQQSERTGLSIGQVTKTVTDVWRRTDNGASFAIALDQEGYVLARGDRRQFVVIDPMGGTHSLARRVEGAKVADVRARMSDLDPAHLPSVKQGKAIQLQRRQGRGVERIRDGQGEHRPSRQHDAGRAPEPHAKPSGIAGKAIGGATSIASVLFNALTGETPARTDNSPAAARRAEIEKQHTASVSADQSQKDKIRQEILRTFTTNQERERSDDLGPERDRTRR